jgi:homoserine O-acetyltransferase
LYKQKHWSSISLSDQLCTIGEQKILADHIPNFFFVEMDSTFGHDAFLIEVKLIAEIIKQYL